MSENPQPPAAPKDDTSAISPVPLALPGLDDPARNKRYQVRFGAVYAALGLVFVAAMAGFVVILAKPGHKPPPPWSAWRPASGTVSQMTSEIADHVSHKYRVSAGGAQLVAVVPSKPTVTSGTTNIAIKAIAIRKTPSSNAGIEVLPSNKSEMFTFCGLGSHCSISTGTATALRGRLVRREALEVALYTFKFVPSIDSVIAFMPPPPNATTASVLFLRKENFAEALGHPLNTTLDRTTPPLPTEADLSEATTIDAMTLDSVFSYSLTALQTGGAAIVLDPAT
jgi:hypothetical protein